MAKNKSILFKRTRIVLSEHHLIKEITENMSRKVDGNFKLKIILYEFNNA